MIRKDGGDGHTPDNDVENIPQPEVGSIYRREKKGNDTYDFVRIDAVVEALKDKHRRARVKYSIWDSKKNEWVKKGSHLSGEILLENFLKQNADVQYTKYADSEEEFHSKAPASSEEPIEERPEPEEAPVVNEEPPANEQPEAVEEPSSNKKKTTDSTSSEEKVEGKNQIGVSNLESQRKREEYERKRAPLEEALTEARMKFVQDDYQYSTQTNKLTRFFGLTPDTLPPRESLHALEYGEALKKLRDYEFAYLQDNLDSFSVVERKEEIKSFLLKYRHQEAIELYSLGKEVQLLAENETVAGRAKTYLKELGNGYRKMSFKKKMAITAGVIGIGALSGAAASLAGVASLAYVTKRVVAGSASYLAIDEGANTFLAKRAQRKAEKEVEEIAGTLIKEEVFRRAEDTGSAGWQDLLDRTNEKLKDINKDLEKLKTREKRIKLAAFAGALGLPSVAQTFGVFEGGFGGSATTIDASPVESLPVESATEEFPPEESIKIVPPTTPENITAPAEEIKIPVVEAPAEVGVPPEPAPAPTVGIGFKDTPLTPEQQYWRDIRDGQGRYRDSSGFMNPGGYGPDPSDQEGYRDLSAEVTETSEAPQNLLEGNATFDPESVTASADISSQEEILSFSDQAEPASATADSAVAQASYTPEPNNVETGSVPSPDAGDTGAYSYEESQYKSLPAELRPLWKDSMILLQQELLDINNSEFGPDYVPTNWQADQLWAAHKGNSMQDILAFNNPRYDYDPRDSYRNWQEQQIGRRGIYLAPMNPGPQLGDGPDPYAIHTMDKIREEYRQNLVEMQRTALASFGKSALPTGRAESVQEYMGRVATMYARARAENPNFRLKF